MVPYNDSRTVFTTDLHPQFQFPNASPGIFNLIISTDISTTQSTKNTVHTENKQDIIKYTAARQVSGKQQDL